MSTKSTLFSTPCCHIYKDYYYSDDGWLNSEREMLCISVSYEYRDDESDYIEVEWDSDFSVLIRALLDIADHDQLDRLCRENFSKRNESHP